MLTPVTYRRTFVCLATCVAMAAVVRLAPAQGLAATAQPWRLKSLLPGFVPRHQRSSAGTGVASGRSHTQRPAGHRVARVGTPANGSTTRAVHQAELVAPLPASVAVEAESEMDLSPVEPLSLEAESMEWVADDCSCSSCQPTSCPPAPGWGPEVIPGFWVDHLSILGGVHGFKNPANRGEDGSFGFHTGLNYGTPARNILLPPTIGWQTWL